MSKINEMFEDIPELDEVEASFNNIGIQEVEVKKTVKKHEPVIMVNVEKPVKKIESIKSEKKTKESKKEETEEEKMNKLKKKSFELQISELIIKETSLRKLDELSGSSILVYFDNNLKVWKAVSCDDDLQEMVVSGVKKSGFLSLLSKNFLESTKYVLTSLCYSSNKYMPKNNREIIAIEPYVDNNGDIYEYLEIKKDKFVLLKADKNLGVTKFFNLKVKEEQLTKEKNEIFYNPVLNYSKKGLLQQTVFEEFNKKQGFRDTLQEYLGDSMLKLNSQVWAILKGTGMNAKGVTIALMTAATSKFSTAMDLSTDGTFDLQKLPGKEYIICDEVKKVINESKYKKLIGESVMDFGRKFLSNVNGFVYRGKGIMATNNSISASDKGFSMIRRMTIFLFDGNVEEAKQIPGVADLIIRGGEYTNPVNREEILSNEAQINEWIDFLLLGAQRVLKRGILLKGSTLPACLIEDKSEAVSEMIPQDNFIRELEIRPSDSEVISKNDLYELWIMYCKKNGHVGFGTKNTFLSEFKRIFATMYPSGLKESKTARTETMGPQHGYKITYAKDNYIENKQKEKIRKEELLELLDIKLLEEALKIAKDKNRTEQDKKALLVSEIMNSPFFDTMRKM